MRGPALDPCDACGQRPATRGYYCHVCAPSERERDWERLMEGADEAFDRWKDEGGTTRIGRAHE